MKIILILLLCFTTSTLLAQTKKIAFKSHSGKMENFLSALETGGGDTENFNFGVGIEPTVKFAQLDSLILLCDTAVIMVTSEYCLKRRYDEKDSKKWNAGKDTVFNHPVFSGYLSLDSIKSILKNQYHFRNPVKKTVFIGFEEPITMNRKKKESAIMAFKGDDHLNSNGSTVLITTLIFGLSLLGGLLSWKLYKPAV